MTDENLKLISLLKFYKTSKQEVKFIANHLEYYGRIIDISKWNKPNFVILQNPNFLTKVFIEDINYRSLLPKNMLVPNQQQGIPQQNNRTPIPSNIRWQVFQKYNYTCQYCGKKPPEVQLEVDHVIPVSQGGSDDINNLTVACFDCNRSKGGK